MPTYFVVGGAGFIGSHFVDRLLSQSEVTCVSIFDNFSSGREWHFAHHLKDSRFKVFRGEVKNLSALTESMAGHETVIHLASNPDIAKAMTDPSVDFDEGTLLTHHVVEAMRRSGAKRILYASGSGIYGDLGEREAREDHGPLIPVSTYGASKLAGEALISSYAHMFGLRGLVFRFGNVVGPRQTHGVGFDFARKLLKDPTSLTVLGNGTQSKSYVHVDDVVAAVLGAERTIESPFEAFNVATGDYITVREIAELATECLGLQGKVAIQYGSSDRGWKGDVPVVRINTDKIKQRTGWRPSHNSREALKAAILAMIPDLRAGKL